MILLSPLPWDPTRLVASQFCVFPVASQGHLKKNEAKENIAPKYKGEQR